MENLLKFEEIDILAEKLADFVDKNDVVALVGDLGTGKTTFVKVFAKRLGISSNIKSPTFNYVIEYLEGKYPLYHFDVYRIGEPEEIYEVGYEDYLYNDGICIIEWANLIEEELPDEYIRVELDYHDEFSRRVKLDFIGNKKREEELLEYVSFSN
jgi:tRNA threonylcarbamoyladenosine biosynthesis protein TsaE